MAKFTVLTPLDHDGVHYEAGETVDIVGAKQIKLLVDSEVIKPDPKGKNDAGVE